MDVQANKARTLFHCDDQKPSDGIVSLKVCTASIEYKARNLWLTGDTRYGTYNTI